ncbi:MAG: trigger factor, partial [Lachnospiraceae bacterium]|nr:trigger factor [Lachnospiraceae bacterium]
DIENEYKKMAEQYQMELDKVKELIGENEKKQIAMDLKVEKAVEFIASNAVEK